MASLKSIKPSTVLLVTHDACAAHDIKDHPEQPLRVSSIVTALTKAYPPGSSHLVLEKEPPRVTDEALLRFHTPQHVKSVLEACKRAEAKTEALLAGKKQTNGGRVKGNGGSDLTANGGGGKDLASRVTEALSSKDRKKFAKHLQADATVNLDGDTACMWATREASLRACGAAVAAVDAVMTGQHASAFVAVRPPGHHAEPDSAMGFCFFGNAGVAALHARATYGLARVAVVDWDVHHGNGTQAFFEKDPTLFFASSHQRPCFPGTGDPKEKGCSGNVVNVGLKPGSGSEAFRSAWRGLILPALAAFDPELVVVSAGFDAHGDDPLAEVRLCDEDFYWVQKEILAVCHRGACQGRLVSVLEGGYDLEATSRSAVECVRAQLEAAANSPAASAASAAAAAPIDEASPIDTTIAATNSGLPPAIVDGGSDYGGIVDADGVSSGGGDGGGGCGELLTDAMKGLDLEESAGKRNFKNKEEEEEEEDEGEYEKENEAGGGGEKGGSGGGQEEVAEEIVSLASNNSGIEESYFDGMDLPPQTDDSEDGNSDSDSESDGAS